MRHALAAALLLFPAFAFAEGPGPTVKAELPSNGASGDGEAEAKKVAETYLNALTGKGDESGKVLLLGGATMNAQLFTLENWSFNKKDAFLHEEKDLAHAVQMMNDLDKAGRSALTKLMGAEAV